MYRLLSIGHVELVATIQPGDVNILPNFYESFRTQDRQPAISPGLQPVRREPVDPQITCPAIPLHHHIPEILKLRILWMMHVADLRGHHLGFCRSREMQELVQLMRSDIRDDAAKVFLVKKPFGP